MSLISTSRPPPLLLWRSSRTAAHPGVSSGCLVGQLGFLYSGNVDIVAVVESQQISYFSAYSVRVPFHQSLTVSGCWCRERSRVHFNIAGTLKQKSEQQCRHRTFRHQRRFNE